MKHQGIVLIYEWEREKERQFRRFCEIKDIKVKSISPDLYSETMGVLAEISGIRKNGKQDLGGKLGEEMMVFAGIDSEKIGHFLDTCYMAGIRSVQLKAVITPYNIFWNSRQLYQELKRERESLLSTRSENTEDL